MVYLLGFHLQSQAKENISTSNHFLWKYTDFIKEIMSNIGLVPRTGIQGDGWSTVCYILPYEWNNKAN